MTLRLRLVALFVVGVALDILLSGPMLAAVSRGELFNPDSYMRLVRLREMLIEGRVLHAVDADNGTGGILLHWSHLLDGVLLLMAAPLRLFLDRDAALFWSGAVSGPLSVGLLSAACAWAVAPLVAPSLLWLASVAAAVSIGTLTYGLVGSVHHHVFAEAIAVVIAGLPGARRHDGLARNGC